MEQSRKIQQKPIESNILPQSKGVQLLGGQKVPENFDAIGIRDSMKINTPLGNKKSGREDEIATKIEQLKKK